MTQSGGTDPARPATDNDADERSRRQPLPSPFDQIGNRGQRRRDRIVQEVLANRRGEYRVPTWVLAALLVAIVGGFVVWMLLL